MKLKQPAKIGKGWGKIHLNMYLNISCVHCLYLFLCLYRAWPTLHVEPLSNKNVKELIHAELATMDAQIGSEDGLILTHCRTPATCSPLYVMVLTRHIAGWGLLCVKFRYQKNKILLYCFITLNSYSNGNSLLTFCVSSYNDDQNWYS